MSFDRLQDRIDAMQNPTVAGLDPVIAHVPEFILARHIAERGETLEAVADAFLEFNRGLIDALRDIVPAVKPQSAFYEALGPAGVDTLKKTADYAKASGMYVIGDLKRGDIGSTAEGYAAAYLGTVNVGGKMLAPFDFDAITVNAYLGSDGVLPFLETAKQRDKAIFVLVKTSNPSSGDLQDKFIADKRVYEVMAELIESIGGETGERGFTRAGMVIGATYPDELRAMRERHKTTFFLVPGYGAQGGSAMDAAKAFLPGGQGAIVNSSRAIIAAWKKTGHAGSDYQEAARHEAIKMRDDLRDAVYG